MLHIILYVLAIVLLFLAAFGVNHPRINLGWLGLAVLALTLVI